VYLVARHAPGGLQYLTAEGTWARARRCGEAMPLELAVAIVRDYVRHGVRGVHARDAWRNALTCRPVGRPRASE
jgi:hypothetical protein